jgi:hypothetical protein
VDVERSQRRGERLARLIVVATSGLLAGFADALRQQAEAKKTK